MYPDSGTWMEETGLCQLSIFSTDCKCARRKCPEFFCTPHARGAHAHGHARGGASEASVTIRQAVCCIFSSSPSGCAWHEIDRNSQVGEQQCEPRVSSARRVIAAIGDCAALTLTLALVIDSEDKSPPWLGGMSRPSAIRGMSRCRHAYSVDWVRGRQRQNSVSCSARALPCS
jgi:hypothetical protein